MCPLFLSPACSSSPRPVTARVTIPPEPSLPLPIPRAHVSGMCFLSFAVAPSHLSPQVPAPVMPRRSRGWSTSCSSTTSQSSMASIYARINQCPLPAEPKEGHANVYGSFTTTIPATLWLRNLLSLFIPAAGKRRAKRRILDCGYDTRPDSPLSFLPGSSRSPSISRTMLTDSDTGGPSMGPGTSPHCPSLPFPAKDEDDNATTLHPVLKALERGSRLSCRTTCSTCRKAGTNFPRCPRCGEMWCSRPCRLRGGRKHVCAISTT